jgi:hypothetical protein
VGVRDISVVLGLWRRGGWMTVPNVRFMGWRAVVHIVVDEGTAVIAMLFSGHVGRTEINELLILV